MDNLVTALQGVFQRWLNDGPRLSDVKELAALELPPVDPAATLTAAQIHLLTRRQLVDTTLLSWRLEEVLKWDESKELGALLQREPELADVPDSVMAQIAPRRLIAAVVEDFLEAEPLRPKSGAFGADGLWHHRFANPVFNERILDSCARVIAAWRIHFSEPKRNTIYIPLHGARVWPPAPVLQISDDTRICHVSQLPAEVIFRIRESYKSYAIRNVTDHGFCLVHDFVSAFRDRASHGNGVEVRELAHRFVAAIRLSCEGWVAAPLAIQHMNLPWIEPKDYAFNQNLPWSGICTISPAAAPAIEQYWRALGDPAISPLTQAAQAPASLAYARWALEQLDHIASAANDSSRASHLFIAVEALFGVEGNSATTWVKLPQQLFHHSTRGYDILSGVMEASYRCRNELFHEGITPPKRFYQHHFAFLYRLVVETLKWVLDNKVVPEVASKDVFVKYVRSQRPQAIKTTLADKPFSARL